MSLPSGLCRLRLVGRAATSLLTAAGAMVVCVSDDNIGALLTSVKLVDAAIESAARLLTPRLGRNNDMAAVVSPPWCRVQY